MNPSETGNIFDDFMADEAEKLVEELFDNEPWVFDDEDIAIRQCCSRCAACDKDISDVEPHAFWLRLPADDAEEEMLVKVPLADGRVVQAIRAEGASEATEAGWNAVIPVCSEECAENLAKLIPEEDREA